MYICLIIFLLILYTYTLVTSHIGQKIYYWTLCCLEAKPRLACLFFILAIMVFIYSACQWAIAAAARTCTDWGFRPVLGLLSTHICYWVLICLSTLRLCSLIDLVYCPKVIWPQTFGIRWKLTDIETSSQLRLMNGS